MSDQFAPESVIGLLRNTQFGLSSGSLAAIGWLGSLGGQVWVTVAWTWGESAIVLGPAEYAALSAVLIPILAGTTGYWIWRLRNSFGAVARFRELDGDIEDGGRPVFRDQLLR